MDYDVLSDNLQDLIDRRDTKHLIVESFKEIRFNHKSAWQYVISFLLAMVVAGVIGFSQDTVILMKEVISELNTIIIGLLATVFGSYSIFQALLNRDLVKQLIVDKENILKKSNTTFLNFIIIYMINILVNFVLGIFIKAMDPRWTLFSDLLLSNIFATFLICIYIAFSLVCILETINFAINLYRMFCIHNTLQALDVLDDMDNNSEE